MNVLPALSVRCQILSRLLSLFLVVPLLLRIKPLGFSFSYEQSLGWG